MTNIYWKLLLVFLVLAVLTACGRGGNEPGQSNDPQTLSSIEPLDDDDDDDRRRHDDDDDDDDDDDGRGDGDGGGGDGDGTAAGPNVIAVHNPDSSQYDDNCLTCHGDIPDSQSLDTSVPNAHVAMLAFTPGEGSDQCAWCHRDVSNTLVYTAAQVGNFQVNIRKTVDSQLCAICHGPVGPGKQFFQAGLTTAADPDGAQLYDYLCAACHGELANSQVKGESTQDIYDAIAENEGGMAPLSVLQPAWIQAITVALGGDPTLPADIPAPGTGASLYQQYCSSCHGALASSTKTGASASQIQNAINSINEMSSLSFLTAPEIQTIAEALSGGGGGTGGGGTGGGTTDGASLYQANCAACHGDLANSEHAGASASLIQSAINNVGDMSSLSFLTTTQVQAIADALSGGGGGSGGGGTGDGGTGGGTTDGASLYQANCATCHGDLANSSQSGASASQIQNAINSNRGGMGVLSSLTSTQIQAIADALSGGGGGSTGGGGTGDGGTGSTDGVALYQSYCASCHGALNESEVSNESADEIQEAIEDNDGGMSTLEFLTDDQIDAIAAALD